MNFSRIRMQRKINRIIVQIKSTRTNKIQFFAVKDNSLRKRENTFVNIAANNGTFHINVFIDIFINFKSIKKLCYKISGQDLQLSGLNNGFTCNQTAYGDYLIDTADYRGSFTIVLIRHAAAPAEQTTPAPDASGGGETAVSPPLCVWRKVRGWGGGREKEKRGKVRLYCQTVMCAKW